MQNSEDLYHETTGADKEGCYRFWLKDVNPITMRKEEPLSEKQQRYRDKMLKRNGGYGI